MEEVQEQKFVCKFCHKSCLSGKSLGGHMRCHLDLIAAAKKDKVKAESKHGDGGIIEEINPNNTCNIVSAEQSNSSFVQEKVDDCNMNLGNDDDQDSYSLRDNPKKSWKISDLENPRAPKKTNLCKECGKRFPSSRALAGHMRTHSTKGKNRHHCKNCNKGFDSMRALFGHMKSHPKRSGLSTQSADGLSEFEMDYPRKKRSVLRYKISQNLSFSSANGSSSSDETEEAEEAAKCLMMLSRGVIVKNWDDLAGFDSKSFPHCEEMTEIAADDSLCNADEIGTMEKPSEELDSASSVSEQNVSEFNDSDSEFVIVNEKKGEQGVCFLGLLHNDKSKRSRQVEGSAVQLDDNKILRASDSTESQDVKDLVMEVGTDEDAHDPELRANSSDMVKCANTISGISNGTSERKRMYKCRTCDMIFYSHQALGGHRNRHKTIRSRDSSTESSFLSDNESNDTPIEPGLAGMARTVFDSAKSKEHECPICFKVFLTGQALGGHKRAHYVGLTESRFKETTVDNQEIQDIPNIFDLNLPVISHQEAKDHDVRLKLWWSACSHEREPLLISN